MKTKASQKPKIRLGIFDDDPLRVIGFRALLDAERDLELKITGDSEHSEGIEIDVAGPGNQAIISVGLSLTN